jgi:hypothetical protein
VGASTEPRFAYGAVTVRQDFRETARRQASTEPRPHRRGDMHDMKAATGMYDPLQRSRANNRRGVVPNLGAGRPVFYMLQRSRAKTGAVITRARAGWYGDSPSFNGAAPK